MVAASYRSSVRIYNELSHHYVQNAVAISFSSAGACNGGGIRGLIFFKDCEETQTLPGHFYATFDIFGPGRAFFLIREVPHEYLCQRLDGRELLERARSLPEQNYEG